MCQLSDNFYSAVRVLAGDGPVKQRLADAYCQSLEMISEDDLPESIRPRFQLLRQAMHTAKPLGSEHPVLASVRKMSSTDASRYAMSIVAMFSELVRVKATGERVQARSVAVSEATVTEAEAPEPDRRSLN